jgi:hypothetical protein
VVPPSSNSTKEIQPIYLTTNSHFLCLASITWKTALGSTTSDDKINYLEAPVFIRVINVALIKHQNKIQLACRENF